ncbi:hypothetical protein [Campylobacter helveticus]|uniref:hypothetical protein n=1 Tax=Campylobacter helveticus TaxID=28898 RepID=UPI001486CEE7|nr:hypothetical protein [Campylobacter helveticus]
MTYVIPLQELLENEELLEEAINQYIKKSLSQLDLVTNFIESKEVYHKTKNFRKAIVHFTSNLIGGTVVAVGIVGGVRTARLEITTIIHANDIPIAIENATNKAFDAYDNALDTILEFILNGTVSLETTNFLNSIYERFFAPRKFKKICDSPEECQILQQDNFQILINNFSLLTPHPYPTHSKEYKFALAKKKELLAKTTLTSNAYIKSDISFIDKEYLNNIQDLKEQERIIKQEEQKHQLALKLYKETNQIKNAIFTFLFKSLNESLSFQLKKERSIFLNSNQSLSIIASQNYLLKVLSLKEIESVNVNSNFAHLRALYLRENLLILNKNNETLFNEEKAKEILEYNDDEYILFISHKTKLNDTYLEARKRLYKSIDTFKIG